MNDLCKHEIGSVLSFEYQLINHPETWMRFEGILLKKSDKTGSTRFWCVRNEHLVAFSGRGGVRAVSVAG